MQNAQIYRHLVDSLTDYGVLMVDAAGVVLSWNIGAERLTGFTAKEMIGQNISALFLPPSSAADNDDPQASIAQALLEAATHDNAAYSLVVQMQTRSGAVQSVHASINAIHAATHNITYNTDHGTNQKKRKNGDPIQHENVDSAHSAEPVDSVERFVCVLHPTTPALSAKAGQAKTEHVKDEHIQNELQHEVARRMALEAEVEKVKIELQQRINQRTDLLQEAILQLQEEVARRDEVESKLRQRTEIMHDFIQQLEQEMEERKHIESALRLSEERFRNVIERSPIGICIADEHGVIDYINPACCALISYSAQEMTGSVLSSIIAPQSRTEFEAAFTASFGGSSNLRGEWNVIDKHRNHLTILTDAAQIVQALPIGASAGAARFSGASPAPAVRTGSAQKQIIFAMDITQRKHAEDLYKRAKVVVDQSPAVIYQFANTRGYPIEFVSENISQFGYTPEDMMESLSSSSGSISLFFAHPEDREYVREVFRLLREKKAYHLRREFRLLTKDGGFRWVENNLVATRDPDGTITHYQGVLFDITGRKMAEEEISRALAKERELLDLKARFITIASHEFRTPLTSIMLAAGIMKDFGSMLTPEQQDDNLILIRQSVEHMTQLLEDLLMYDRVDSASVQFRESELEMCSWSQEFFTRKQNTSAKNHSLNFTLPDEGHSYTGDETLLVQMLERLLSNAFKYSPSGSEINVVVQADEQAVTFVVEDSGIGIPSDDIGRIFEPFHRGANIGEIGGSGMGLAILHKLVELHGGSLSVASEVGVGTTMTLQLPMNAADIFIKAQTRIKFRAVDASVVEPER